LAGADRISLDEGIRDTCSWYERNYSLQAGPELRAISFGILFNEREDSLVDNFLVD
jgi:hypothetical protein